MTKHDEVNSVRPQLLAVGDVAQALSVSVRQVLAPRFDRRNFHVRCCLRSLNTCARRRGHLAQQGMTSAIFRGASPNPGRSESRFGIRYHRAARLAQSRKY